MEAAIATRIAILTRIVENLPLSHPKAIERPLQSLKTVLKELAQIPLMRQLSEPFLAEGGIRLPRYRVMRQQPSFAQARWFLSIVSIERDAVSLTVVEKGRDCYFSGRSEQVCELRISFCPVIAGVN